MATTSPLPSGISNVTTTPGYGAPFLQPLGQQIGNLLSGALSQPVDLAGQLPQVAQQNVLQQQAAQQAATQAGLGNLQFNTQGQLTGATCGSGIAGYQPYLTSAAANVGPNAYQQYMSPYQQQVIAPTLQQYDIQSQINKQALPAAAIQAGAYGGARCGVEQGVYQSQSDLNRSVLQAQLEQQGFTQAQQAASTAFGQNLALSTTQPTLAAATYNLLNTAGGAQNTYSQGILNAMTTGNALLANYPFTQLQQAANIYSPLAAYTPGTPGAPLLTSPAQSAAQAIADTLGGVGSTNIGNALGSATSGIGSLLSNLFGSGYNPLTYTQAMAQNPNYGTGNVLDPTSYGAG